MTDQAKIVGGPLDNENDENAGTGNQAAQTTENNTENASKKYKTASGREFESVEDMQSYLNTLEETAVRNQLQLQSAQSQTQVQAPVVDTKKEEDELAELMYTDPVAYNKRMKESVRKEFESQRNLEEARKNFWNGFYEKNPDLRNCTRIVQSIHMELATDPAFASLPASAGAERIASEVRSALKGVIGSGGTEQVINGRPAPVMSGSNPTVKAPPAPEKTRTFLDQVKEMRAKRRAS